VAEHGEERIVEKFVSLQVIFRHFVLDYRKRQQSQSPFGEGREIFPYIFVEGNDLIDKLLG
jgi:hypothetical protein